MFEDDVFFDGIKVRKDDFVYYVLYFMGWMLFLRDFDVLEFKFERWFKDGVF